MMMYNELLLGFRLPFPCNFVYGFHAKQHVCVINVKFIPARVGGGRYVERGRGRRKLLVATFACANMRCSMVYADLTHLLNYLT